MASKNINVLLSLADKFTAPMKRVGETTKDTERKMTAMHNKLTNFGGNVNDKFLGIASSIGKMGLAMTGLGAFAGVAAIVDYGKQALSVAEKAATAQSILRNSLANNNSMYGKSAEEIDAAQKQLNDYAGKWGAVGVISKGAIVAGYSELNKWNVPVDKIDGMSEALTNLVAGKFGINATADDAKLASQAIGRAFNGDVAGLTKMKIPLTDVQKEIIKNGNAAQRMATINEVVNGTFSKQNEILANTPEGKMKKMQNQQAAMMATIGKSLLPMQTAFMDMASTIMPIIAPVIQDIFGVFSGVFSSVATIITDNKEIISSTLTSAMVTVKSVLQGVGTTVKWCVDNLGFLTPILKTVAGGFVVFNVLAKIIPIFSSIFGGIMKVIQAVRLLGVLMAANPVLFAIYAIIAVIALLIYNWDTIKAVALEVWDAIASKVSEVGSAIGEFIDGVVAWFSSTWTSIIDIALSVWGLIVQTCADFVSNVIVYVVYLYDSFMKTFSPIVEGVSKIFQGIIDFVVGVFTGNWDKAWSGVKEIFTGYWEVMEGVANGVINWVTDKLNWIGDKINTVREGTSGLWDKVTGGGDAPHNALGTKYFKGGQTYVNEGNRGELIKLPSGSEIVPHDKSMQRLASSNNAPIVNINISGNLIGNEEFLDQCGRYFTDKVMLAMNNM